MMTQGTHQGFAGRSPAGAAVKTRVEGRLIRRGFAAAAAGIVALAGFLIAAGAVLHAAEPAPTPATNTSAHAIAFTNGDVLLGRLESIDSQGGVRWRHPDALAPIQFSPGSVADIRFAEPAATPVVCSNRALVKLTNLDELEGGLRSLDDKELVLETSYAGMLRIPRSRVQTILPLSQRLATVFEGPESIEGWTIGQVNVVAGKAGQWRYFNGAFYAREAASVARDIKLPESASLEFDIEWRGRLNLAVALYTDYMHPVSLGDLQNQPDFGGFYSLQIHDQLASLLFVTKREPAPRQLGQAIVPVLAQKNRARIAVKCSRVSPQISLLVDGAIVRQWVDTEGFGAEGTGIRLVHQGQGMIRLSNLRATEWDGRFEEPAPARADGKSDLVLLVNSDRVAGELKEIRDGRLALKAGASALNIPLNRVSQIELAGDKQTRDAAPKDSVRAWFTQRGSVTFSLEKWDERGAVANSPNFGGATFDPRAFSRLEFQVGR